MGPLRDKPFPRIVLGSLALPDLPAEHRDALLDRAVELGCNAFDTAHVYRDGDAERVLGDWLARRVRERIIVITKGGHPENTGRSRVSPSDITRDMHESLERLRCGHIDLYLVHRDGPNAPVGPLVEMLNEHIENGHISAYGLSNWTTARVEEALTYARTHDLRPPVAVSPYYGLAEMMEDPWGGSVSIRGAEERKTLDWYDNAGMIVLAYAVLGRGLLSGRIDRRTLRSEPDRINRACRVGFCHDRNFDRIERATAIARQRRCSVAQVAISWVLSQPHNLAALVGVADRRELQDTHRALDIELSPSEIAWLA
jgi:aryl-alcohol dehydrogenase-like predicted oxidoreductase